MCDLNRGETAHRAQRESYLRFARERRVAAHKHQWQSIVLLRRLSRCWLLERGELFTVASITPHLVERAVARYRHQPRSGTLWNTIDGPAFERDEQRILHK